MAEMFWDRFSSYGEFKLGVFACLRWQKVFTRVKNSKYKRPNVLGRVGVGLPNESL